MRIAVTGDVPRGLRLKAIEGIERAFASFPILGERFRLEMPNSESTERVEGLVANLYAAGRFRATTWGGRQIYADSLLDELQPWTVVLCAEDLTYPGSGWIFGVTRLSMHISFQSIARFLNKRIGDEERQAAVARLLTHEIGHMLGAADYTRGTNLVHSYGWHCTNPCSMRQALTPLRWIKCAMEEESQGITFCEQCAGDIMRKWGPDS